MSKDTRRARQREQQQAETETHKTVSCCMLVPRFLPLSMPSAPFGTCRQHLDVVRGWFAARKRAAKSLSHQEQRHVRRARTQRLLYFTFAFAHGNDFTRLPSHTHRHAPQSASSSAGKRMLSASHGQAATASSRQHNHLTCITLGPGPRLPYCSIVVVWTWKPSCPPPITNTPSQWQRFLALAAMC